MGTGRRSRCAGSSISHPSCRSIIDPGPSWGSFSAPSSTSVGLVKDQSAGLTSALTTMRERDVAD